MEISRSLNDLSQLINKMMEELNVSATYNKLVEFLKNLPDDIQETVLFQRIIKFEKSEITYEDVQWILDIFGYENNDTTIQILRNRNNMSDLDKYILFIIESEKIAYREKLIVLLAHMEPLVYQTISYERKSWDRVKHIVSQNVKQTHEMEMESYAKVLLAGIVFIVFSNVDSYENDVDRRIPFRNYILHRGAMSYSEEEIKKAYETLVFFISQMVLLED